MKAKPLIPSLPVGKLQPELLKRFLEAIPQEDPRVVVGPRIGEDAAVLDLGDRYLVWTTDPITFATAEIGWYGVQVNANDLAVRGVQPRWFTMVLLLPEGKATEALVEGIFDQVIEACRLIGATLVGGHTEVTAELPRPVLIGGMLGEVSKEALVTTSGAQVGDLVLLTKGIAIEGTAILAKEREETLRAMGVSEDLLERAKGFLRRPGISILKEALLAIRCAKVSSMHDPTEGGLSSGLYELAEASKVGLRVFKDRILILPESEQLLKAFHLDPLGTIASGALLLTARPEAAERLLGLYAEEGISAALIGEVVERRYGVTMVEGAKEVPFPRFERDEIARLFDPLDP